MATTRAGSTGAEKLDSWFEITKRGSDYRTEILGGLKTFLTLVYIVFVNPSILSSAADLNGTRLRFDQVLAVTALAGGLLTIIMNVFGKYPFALASVVTGVLLLLCMFISPIAGIIPVEAIAQALVIVGAMMFALVRDLRWDNTSPLATFATILVMPLTYSIANGVGVGVILHTGSELLQGRSVSPLLLVFSAFCIWYFLHGTI